MQIPRKRELAMRNGGGATEVDAGPAKRMRRPSVRLHQPYYENPGHRKLQQQWKANMEGAKKPRTVKTVRAKSKKNGGGSESSKGEVEGVNFDDNVAIGNWKSFNAGNRERDFKRKRVRPSSSKKWSLVESREDEEEEEGEDQEIERFSVDNGDESEKQGEEEEVEVEEEEEEGEEKEEIEEEEEENLGENGINDNLVIENSEPSSPNCSFGNDDGDDKMSDDNDNVGGNGGAENWRGLRNGWDSDGMRGEVRAGEGESGKERDGVKVWLNHLGLGKYAPLFEVHEVDDEVLPFLTLEDLKDMGITAVGSRRKMYASIEKLSKGFQ